jgi:inactivated superfamily I helicase
MKALITRDRYKSRLAKFLDFIGIEAEDGTGLEDKASLTSIGLPQTY